MSELKDVKDVYDYLNKLEIELYEYAERNIKVIEPCKRCTECCKRSGQIATVFEIDRIVEFLNVESNSFSEQIIIKGVSFVFYRFKKVDFGCPFLDGNVCRIYSVRPFQCRTYPVIAFVKHPLPTDTGYKYIPEYKGTKKHYSYFACGNGAIYAIKAKKLRKLVEKRIRFLSLLNRYEVHEPK